jgi:hypothetical protein
LEPMASLFVGADVLTMVLKLHRGDACDGGERIMAGCSASWCTGSSSEVSSGPPTMASLVCPGTWVPSGDTN